jgi:hypothetical protein
MGRQEAIAQERKEECRRAVRAYLYARPATAHHPATIRRKLNEGHEHDFTEEDVEAALNLLLGLGHVIDQRDALGSTTYWKISAGGTLAHERGQ